jgi:hypothetical protein
MSGILKDGGVRFGELRNIKSDWLTVLQLVN